MSKLSQVPNEPLPPAPQPGVLVSVPLSRWGEYKTAYNLHLVEVTPMDNGELIAVVSRGEPGAQPDPPAKPAGALAKVLQGLVAQAHTKPGAPQRHELRGGLRIDVIDGLDGNIGLQISREGVQPSQKEWEVVLAAWPEPLPVVQSSVLEYNHRCYIRSSWSAQPGA